VKKVLGKIVMYQRIKINITVITFKCGKIHSINEYPAYNTNFSILCGYKNHFALMCKDKIKNENKQINTVEENNKVCEYLCLDKI